MSILGFHSSKASAASRMPSRPSTDSFSRPQQDARFQQAQQAQQAQQGQQQQGGRFSAKQWGTQDVRSQEAFSNGRSRQPMQQPQVAAPGSLMMQQRVLMANNLGGGRRGTEGVQGVHFQTTEPKSSRFATEGSFAPTGILQRPQQQQQAAQVFQGRRRETPPEPAGLPSRAVLQELVRETVETYLANNLGQLLQQTLEESPDVVSSLQQSIMAEPLQSLSDRLDDTLWFYGKTLRAVPHFQQPLAEDPMSGSQVEEPVVLEAGTKVLLMYPPKQMATGLWMKARVMKPSEGALAILDERWIPVYGNGTLAVLAGDDEAAVGREIAALPHDDSGLLQFLGEFNTH